MTAIYILAIAMVLLQISYTSSLPVEVNDEIVPMERQKRQAWAWERNLPEIKPWNWAKYESPSKWSFNTHTQGDNTRFTPQYQVNDRFQVAPFIDYTRNMGITNGGVGLRFKFKRNVNDDFDASKLTSNFLVDEDGQSIGNEFSNDDQ